MQNGLDLYQRIVRPAAKGDMVRMEFAEGMFEDVLIEEITDGVVYGVGEDGESYCSILEKCERI